MLAANSIYPSSEMGYRGTGMWAAHLPTHIIYFRAFEKSKKWLHERQKSDPSLMQLSEPVIEAASAACGRVAESLPKHFFDTLRTNKEHSGASYPTIVLDLYRKEGIRGFFRGYRFATTKGVVGVIVQRWVYRKLMDQFEEDHHAN